MMDLELGKPVLLGGRWICPDCRYWLVLLVDNQNGRHDMKCVECARRRALTGS